MESTHEQSVKQDEIICITSHNRFSIVSSYYLVYSIGDDKHKIIRDSNRTDDKEANENTWIN